MAACRSFLARLLALAAALALALSPSAMGGQARGQDGASLLCGSGLAEIDAQAAAQLAGLAALIEDGEEEVPAPLAERHCVGCLIPGGAAPLPTTPELAAPMGVGPVCAGPTLSGQNPKAAPAGPPLGSRAPPAG